MLRGQAALQEASAAKDTTPFLVAGWVTYSAAPRSCPNQLVGDTSWLHDCGAAAFGDQAGASDPTLAAAITFRFVLQTLATGPTVAEVEVHDPRAASCGTARSACDRLMVVQDVLWTGDASTAPLPLTADAVQRVLRTAQPGATFQPLARDGLVNDCGDELAPAALYVPLAYSTATPRVTLVEIEPSSDARARALALSAGVDAAESPVAVACTETSSGAVGSSSSAFRWLAVANVAVMVRTGIRLSAADRSFFTTLAAALAAAAR